jgi:hypothetical protein
MHTLTVPILYSLESITLTKGRMKLTAPPNLRLSMQTQMHKRQTSMFHFTDLWVFKLCLLQQGHKHSEYITN